MKVIKIISFDSNLCKCFKFLGKEKDVLEILVVLELQEVRNLQFNIIFEALRWLTKWKKQEDGI